MTASESGRLLRPHKTMPATFLRCLTGLLGLLLATMPAHAQRTDAVARIENDVAVFAALDKVTARIQKLPVPLGETVQFGALKVTPRHCFTRPPTEQPKTSTFVDVQEVQLDGSTKPLFAGWMFAESPGLNAVEHPVFDVWLTECQKPRLTSAPATAARPGTGSRGSPGATTTPGGTSQPAITEEERRRRPPR
jgi:hypothetical protein